MDDPDLYVKACFVIDSLRDQALEGEVDACDLLAEFSVELALAAQEAIRLIAPLNTNHALARQRLTLALERVIYSKPEQE